MTQLELFDDYPRRGFSRFGFVRSARWLIASWQARTALARIASARKVLRLEDIPPHLRRDIGLPEIDQAPWRNTLNLLSYLRLK